MFIFRTFLLLSITFHATAASALPSDLVNGVAWQVGCVEIQEPKQACGAEIKVREEITDQTVEEIRKALVRIEKLKPVLGGRNLGRCSDAQYRRGLDGCAQDWCAGPQGKSHRNGG
jgi:hypothetical protein